MKNQCMRIALAVSGVLVLASACTAGAGSKAGGGPRQVTLRLATADGPDRPGGRFIEAFARQVKDLSQGALIIDPVWEASGVGVRDWDQAVAREVVSGRFELGMVPVRAWDTEGVTSLRALHAPYLVTSDALVASVTTGELAGELMAGLAKVNVTGLVLVPEGLRHPFGFGRALMSPADFAGTSIRTARSEVSYALFRALGATPDDLNGDDFHAAAADGSLAGTETSFVLASTLPVPAIATANVTFFPKVISLVMNNAALNRLTASEQTIVRDAANRTRDAAIHDLEAESAAAARFCADGGTVVVATDKDLREFEDQARAVYADLERDAQTRALIERIRAQKLHAPIQPVIAVCGVH